MCRTPLRIRGYRPAVWPSSCLPAPAMRRFEEGGSVKILLSTASLVGALSLLLSDRLGHALSYL